jgi:hypothetical protein
MNLLVERLDGSYFEYPNTDRSKVVIEFVENLKCKTVIYYPRDFKKIEVIKRPKKNTVSMSGGIEAVIEVIDRTVAISESYDSRHLREYYKRDMAAIRAMLAGLKYEGVDDVS